MKRIVSFKNYWLFVPLFGILAYILLYVIATFYYPGGSTFDRTHPGFDWVNNYWCDLIGYTAKNGMINSARPIALTGMIILLVSLSVLWYYLPSFFHEHKINKIVMRSTGIFAMGILLFIVTPMHDTIISIGGGLSSIPLAVLLKDLYLNQWNKLFVLGVTAIGSIALNFYIYLTEWGLTWLPLIQKISFVLFLVWIYLIVLYCKFLLQSADSSPTGSKNGLFTPQKTALIRSR